MPLAAISDAAEPPGPGSLSNRLTPSGNDGANGWWQYELIAGLYPHSREIVLSALIRLSASDVAK